MKNALFCTLIISCIFTLPACTQPQPGQVTSASVYYTVTSTTSDVFSVVYYIPDGNISDALDHTTPFASAAYTFTSGQQIGITVKNVSHSYGNETLTVGIYKDGAVWKTTTQTIGYLGTITLNGSL